MRESPKAVVHQVETETYSMARVMTSGMVRATTDDEQWTIRSEALRDRSGPMRGVQRLDGSGLCRLHGYMQVGICSLRYSPSACESMSGDVGSWGERSDGETPCTFIGLHFVFCNSDHMNVGANGKSFVEFRYRGERLIEPSSKQLLEIVGQCSRIK